MRLRRLLVGAALVAAALGYRERRLRQHDGGAWPSPERNRSETSGAAVGS